MAGSGVTFWVFAAGAFPDSRTEDESTTGGRVGRELLGVAVGEGNDSDAITAGGRGFAGLANDGDSTIIDGIEEFGFAKEGDSTIIEGRAVGTTFGAFFTIFSGTRGVLVEKGTGGDRNDNGPAGEIVFDGA